MNGRPCLSESSSPLPVHESQQTPLCPFVGNYCSRGIVDYREDDALRTDSSSSSKAQYAEETVMAVMVIIVGALLVERTTRRAPLIDPLLLERG